MRAGVACIARGELHGFFQRLEAGLAQQDRAAARWRAFDHGLGIDAACKHAGLRSVDVQRARGQVIDVRAAEADHIGDQAVRVVQRVVGGERNRRIAMPAEGLQRFDDEAARIGFIQATLAFCLFDQGQRGIGEDPALGEDGSGLLTQRDVLDQLQPQQRGEHAERVARQRLRGAWAEGGGMHRHSGHREVVIPHRVHAHQREQAAQRRQFPGSADPDRAMALLVEAGAFVGAVQLFGQRRVGSQHGVVDLGHQVDQRAVQRHFGAVHGGHRLGEQAADIVG